VFHAGEQFWVQLNWAKHVTNKSTENVVAKKKANLAGKAFLAYEFASLSKSIRSPHISFYAS
jgi:hypothetical protein